MQAVEQELEQILSEPIASVIERERSAFDELLRQRGEKVVLFGAGKLGGRVLGCLRSIGIEPLAFSDNDSRIWNTKIEGLPVLPPRVAAERFGEEALFVVTIWNPTHWFTETASELNSLGCRHVVPPFPIYWKFSDVLLPFYAQDLPRNLYEQSSDVLKAVEVWADERSRKEYSRQIRWRALGEWTFTRPEGQESYFPDDVFQLRPDEVFMDCGAFDGDTISAVLSRQHGQFRHIIAIEPDPSTFSKLQSYVSGLPDEIRQKISSVQCAISGQRERIMLQDVSVDAFPLPDVLNGFGPVTFIKMDIEGAEFGALTGGRDVIQRDRPTLAICVYHTPNDLWRIPLLMQQLLPEHRLYLRCYEGDGWQTVAYAVPRERVLC